MKLIIPTKIEKSSKGFYGLIRDEPITSLNHNVIYSPNLKLIQLLIDELLQKFDQQSNSSDGVIFRLISNAVDASKDKRLKVSIKSLVNNDLYVKLQSNISIKDNSNLFPVIADVSDVNKLEQMRIHNLNRKHHTWIKSLIRDLNSWERSFALEMGQKGFFILSLALLNNYLTLPIFGEYCLLCEGLPVAEARKNYPKFLSAHKDALLFLKLATSD